LHEGQIDALEAFTQLRTLKLSRNNLDYVGELESCFNLWYLDLSNNRVSLAGFLSLSFKFFLYHYELLTIPRHFLKPLGSLPVVFEIHNSSNVVLLNFYTFIFAIKQQHLL